MSNTMSISSASARTGASAADRWRLAALISAAAAVALWSAASAAGWLLAITCILGWALLAVAAIDLRHFLLPDALIVPLIPIGLAVTWALAPGALGQHFLGACFGFAMFASIREAYYWLRGREGLGFGDAKLVAALGAWLGFEGLPSAVLLAALGGLVVILLQSVAGHGVRLDRRLPFGACLSLGAWLVWLYGPLALR